MEKTLEMRFCQSVMLALHCVLRIVSGNFSFVPKGTVPSGKSPWHARWEVAGTPTWCNFSFFSKFEATPVRKAMVRECVWEKDREVRFYHGDALVAIVTLVGLMDEVYGSTCWAVSKVRYTLYASGSRNETGHWAEVEPEVTSTFGYIKLSTGDQS